MLKIKDSIDLKELEKFGFKPYRTIWSNSGYVGTAEYSCLFEFGDGNYGQDFQTGVTSLNVDSNTRQLTEYIDERFEMYVDVSSFRLSVLFDLIQAGLVEKVEE